jgi:hypothetical protein
LIDHAAIGLHGVGDIDTLLAKFETGAFLRPSPHALNLVDLARALAALAGGGGLELTAGAARLAGLIGPAEHLIFVVADGLGMMLIDHLPPTSFLAAHLQAELRTVFPSATAAVLTTLATGQWPNQHGVTGQWTHLPELAGTADLLRFAARTGGVSLAKLGLTPAQIFPLPALMGGMRRAGLALFPDRVAPSISAGYFSGQSARRGYRTLAEAADLIHAHVTSADGPTYTYLYSPWIDQEAHHHGSRHPAVRAAVSGLAHAIERLVHRLDGRARLVLTADHGLLDTPVAARHWLRPSADLFGALRFPPSGDARAMFLHVRDGAADQLRGRFRARYGDRFCIITVEEAEAIGLLGPGPVAPAARGRLGNLIVISSGVDIIEYVPSGSIDRALSIAAHHSGLSPAEMRVPLVIA